MKEARYREAEGRLWASIGACPKEQRLWLQRQGIRVRIQEIGSGPTVVFVHGASNSGASWAHLAARLNGYRCVLVDRPGCGLSEPLPARLDLDTMPVFAESWLVDLLDALDVREADVVGTSYGGYSVLRTAAAHPDRVRRLLLFGWTFGAPAEPMPLIMRLANVPGLGPLLASIPPNERAVRGMFRRIGLGRALDEGRLQQEVIDCYLALLRHTDTMRNELDAGPRVITLRGLDERVILPDQVLAQVRAPTYLLWGAEDPFGGPQSAAWLAARIPHAVLELLPGGGHAVWLDDIDHAADVATRFLGAVAEAPTA